MEGVEALDGRTSSTSAPSSTLMLFVALALGASIQCTNRGSGQEDTTVASRPIEDVLEAHNNSLMALPGVVGTAIGRCDGTPCIRIFLADTSSDRAAIPARLEGYPVRAEVTGPVRPRDPPARP